jgi:hypothetical protein
MEATMNNTALIRMMGQLIARNMFGNQKSDIPLQNVLGERGNRKIPSTTAIFNMSSANECMALKLGLCKAHEAGVECYAMKAENGIYPEVLPYREKQQKFWLSISAEEFAMQFLILNSVKTNPFDALRLNESGDFHSQKCLDKAEKIARILKRYGITVYCYTSRNDLDYHRVEALRVNGSGFKKDGIVNVFKIIQKKEDKPKGYVLCPQDCRDCDRCMKAGMRTAVVKH